MVGLLFAFMPVLSHPPGQDVDPAQLLRLLIKCARTLSPMPNPRNEHQALILSECRLNPVLSHPPGQEVDPAQLLRLLIECARP